MDDYLFTTLESDVRYSVQDTDGTEYSDTELNNAINEARRFVLDELCRSSLWSLMPEQRNKADLLYNEFSYKNEHDLPSDFFWLIRVKEVGATQSIPHVDMDKFDDEDRADCCNIRASKVGSPVPATANSGTDTFETDGDYAAATPEERTYTITIDAGGATFGWSGSGSGGSGAGEACATTWITLEDGIKVKFGAATGFTAGDVWTFTVYKSFVNIIAFNYDPDTSFHLYYVRDVEPVALVGGVISTVARLEFRRYYDALKLYVEIKLRNRSQESVSQSMKLFAPVSRMILDKSSMIGDDQNGKMEPQFVSEDFI